MKTNIVTTQDQSQRLLCCGVSADTADMIYQTPITASQKATREDILLVRKADKTLFDTDIPAWSLSALLGLLPFKIHNGKYEYWLDIAPMDYGRQWSIGYYCMEKPRVIKGLTHTDSLIECAVQEIEWLTANGYKLNDIKKIGSEHAED